MVDLLFDTIKSEKQKAKKNEENEESQRLIGSIRQTYLCNMGITEGKEREKGAENLFREVMTGIFQSGGKKWMYKLKKCKEFQSG